MKTTSKSYLFIANLINSDVLVDDVFPGVDLLPVPVAAFDADPSLVLGVEAKVALKSKV